MRGAVLHGPGDIRVEQRPDPTIVDTTDAIIRLSATCVCGSDLWPYRGIDAGDGPAPMGHEYCGIVEEVGRDVTSISPGQFVIGSFFGAPAGRIRTQTATTERAATHAVSPTARLDATASAPSASLDRSL